LLQKHYAVLQAVALGEHTLEWNEKTDDELKPDVEGFEKLATTVEAFAATLPEVQQPATKKRAAEAGAGASGASKKPAVEAPSNWRDLVQSGGIEKETVGSIKAICSSLSLKVSGNKKTLIERLATYAAVE
jgi:hypothetical protein